MHLSSRDEVRLDCVQHFVFPNLVLCSGRVSIGGIVGVRRLQVAGGEVLRVGPPHAKEYYIV